MKKFNSRIFGNSFLIVWFLNFVSWLALEAHETQNRFHAVLGIVSRLWTILRFPVYTIFWKFLFSQNNQIYFIGGVLINCIFYALILERIFSLHKKKSKIPPVSTRI